MSVIPTGECVKLQLESSDSIWDRRLEPDDVIKQKLTIISNGQIWLSSYMEGDSEEADHPVRKERLKISADDAKELLTLVDCCSSEITHEYVCDAGTWKLKLSNDAGEETIVCWRWSHRSCRCSHRTDRRRRSSSRLSRPRR